MDVDSHVKQIKNKFKSCCVAQNKLFMSSSEYTVFLQQARMNRLRQDSTEGPLYFSFVCLFLAATVVSPKCLRGKGEAGRWDSVGGSLQLRH